MEVKVKGAEKAKAEKKFKDYWLLVAWTLFAISMSTSTVHALSIRGYVRDTKGGPVAQCDIDMYDADTGEWIFLLNDKTGADGYYHIFINKAGTYHITYSPPREYRLAGYKRWYVLVNGDIFLDDTILEPGLKVTGHVEDKSVPPVPAPNVEIRFFDASTGKSVFAPDNKTNASGNFSVFVPARTYNIIYAPSAGDTLLPTKRSDIIINSDINLGTTALDRGVLIDGEVVDPFSAPVARADADVFDAFTGKSILTVHDDTDANGHYSFAVPENTLDIDFFPPSGSTLAAEEVRGIVVIGSTTLPTTVLPSGVRLDGRVVDGIGQPQSNVDLDLVNLDTGGIYPTARDNSDDLGQYEVWVPPGLYDVRYDAVVGSGLASEVRRQMDLLSGDLSLPDTVLPDGRSVTGRILDADAPEGPIPVQDVKFVVFSDYTGKGHPGVADPTGSDGVFSVVLPSGRWILEPLPPRGSLLITEKLPAVDLSIGDADLGDVFLHRGVTLSGRVVDSFGAVRDVDIDVFDPKGIRVLTPRDDTDPLGQFSVIVPDEATYSMEFEPPMSTDLAAAERTEVLVSGPTDIGDILLERGIIVTGRVVDPSIVPVFDVDLNVLDALSMLYLTPHDDTLSDGTFKIVLPPEGDPLATINYSPPLGSRLLFRSDTGLDLSIDTDLGDIQLDSGFLISGRVTRTDASSVRDVDIDVFDVNNNGAWIRTPHDNTNGAGDYIISVPSGLYNIDYVPLPPEITDERLVPEKVRNVDASTDVSNLDVQLQDGVWVKGRVLNDTRDPIFDADLDFIRSNGTVQFTPEDQTDIDGVYSLVVPPDIYRIVVEPPVGTRYLSTRRDDVDLQQDNLDVPEFILFNGYFLEGTLLDANSSPVEGAKVMIIDPVTGEIQITPGNTTDNNGFFRMVVAPDVYDIEFRPPRSSALPSTRRLSETITADTVLPDTILPVGVVVDGYIFDSGTTPVQGASANFFMDGKVWPTEDNVADTSGRYDTIVPAGTYTIVFEPPLNSGLAPEIRNDVVISSDTALADVHLGTAQTPILDSILPTSASSAGGSSATLNGSGFAVGAAVLIGGINATIVSITSTTITVTVAAHPPALVDVEVINPGGIVSALSDGFECVRQSPDIALEVSRSGDDLVLTWASTGQTKYTIFGGQSAVGMANPVVIDVTTSTSHTILGGAHPARLHRFFDVE